MKIFNYWGKAQSGWHLLPYHSLDVAACAVTLFEARAGTSERFQDLTGLPREALRSCFGAAAALHDLGKLSPSFQEKAPNVARSLGQPRSNMADDVRHDSLGWVLWHEDTHHDLGLGHGEAQRSHIWIQCATGHHGQPPALFDNRRRLIKTSRFFTEEQVVAAREWAQFVTGHFQPQWDAGELLRLKESSWWIAGLINLADWLGSSTEWFPYCAEGGNLIDYWNLALDRAAVAARESGLGRQHSRRRFKDLFPTYMPTALQHKVSELDFSAPYLLIIEESTGGGKTEIALSAAGGDAFFFGLPTMATANGLWGRLTEFGGQQTLMHAKRWLLPDAMGRASAWLNNSSRKSLLSAVGVGTIDQAMLSVLLTRFNSLRIFGLFGRALIIDEVHAYDPYMTRVIERLIEVHAKGGGSVILLSATMPMSVRQQLADAWASGRRLQKSKLEASEFPLVSYVTSKISQQIAVPSYRRKTISVQYTHGMSECFQHIEKTVSENKCIVWIRNTVREALEAYDELSRRALDPFLFHARFVAADRLSIESEVLKLFGKSSTSEHRSGKVLIATQVVEQSLDLDFDAMISDLAPIDLLIQRAGRLHRHNRGDRGEPVLMIHAPTWECSPKDTWVSSWSTGTARVYPDHARLWLTNKAFRNQIILPDHSRHLIEAIYGEGVQSNIPDGLLENFTKSRSMDRKMASSARANLIGKYYEADLYPWTDELAPTRLGGSSTEWVICESGNPIRGEVDRSIVAIRADAIREAPEAAGIDPGSWRKTLNLVNGRADCLGFGNKPVSVTYCDLRGLVWN